MDDSDNDNSNMFKVDHSKQHVCQNMDNRLNNMFDKDTKILKEGQPRKVLYGPMEQQPRTIYEIVRPYLWKMAEATGQAATVAGKGIYSALTTGAQWLYDKMVNTVIPYTAQEIPKLIFIIKNSKNKQKAIQKSDAFQVLEIDEHDYQEIKKKQGKKNKKKIIVPLGENNDPEFVQFLKRENYVPDTSFPIGVDSDQQSQSFLVPSARFMLKHTEAIQKNISKVQSNIPLQQYQTSQTKTKLQPQSQKTENQPSQSHQCPQKQCQSQCQQSLIKSMIDPEMQKVREVENYKKVQKKFYKLKDCYIFELEGKNSIEYDLLDGIEKDDNTKCGYLIKSNKFQIGQGEQEGSGKGQGSGEVPLVTEKIVKKVDGERKVRVQLPKESQKQREKDQIQMYLS